MYITILKRRCYIPKRVTPYVLTMSAQGEDAMRLAGEAVVAGYKSSDFAKLDIAQARWDNITGAMWQECERLIARYALVKAPRRIRRYVR